MTNSIFFVTRCRNGVSHSSTGTHPSASGVAFPYPVRPSHCAAAAASMVAIFILAQLGGRSGYRTFPSDLMNF